MGDRGGVVVWMEEKAGRGTRMVGWDAPGGQARMETSWRRDVCAQGWAGVCPGPWRQTLARQGDSGPIKVAEWSTRTGKAVRDLKALREIDGRCRCSPDI